MAKGWIHPAVSAFDWDRHNDLKYIDWFFSKWGYTPFPLPDPDGKVIAITPPEPPVRKTGPLRQWPEEYLTQHFRSFEDGWR